MPLRAPMDGICQIRIEGPPDHVPREARNMRPLCTRSMLGRNGMCYFEIQFIKNYLVRIFSYEEIYFLRLNSILEVTEMQK